MSEPAMSELSLDELAAQAPPKGAPLSDFQHWMVSLIRQRKALSQSERLASAAGLHVCGNERLSPAQQIEIYRTQFWLRHTHCLLEDFPGVANLLGQQAWEAVAEGYLAGSGRGIFALRDLGEFLPDYLASLPELSHQTMLVEMARLEWAYIEAFDAQDDPVLSPENLAAIAPEAWANAHVQLSHSLTLLSLTYPVNDLRRRIQAAPRTIDPATISEDRQNLVVYRRNRSLFDKSLSPPAFQLLSELKAGTALIPACEAVVNQRPEYLPILEAELMAWFALWGRLGWVTDIHVA